MGRLARNKLFWAVGTASLALALYLAFGVFGVHTRFMDTEVNEEFKAGAAPATAEQRDDPPASTDTTSAASENRAETRESSRAEQPQAEQPASAAAREEARAEPSDPVRVSAGRFHDVEYSGTGDAIVYRLEDGSHVLRLENLNVENGPDLHVYAVADPDAFDAGTVLEAGFVDAGPLKGNQGNQTYPLPDGFDPEVHRAVTVWCVPFRANFVTAPLR